MSKGSVVGFGVGAFVTPINDPDNGYINSCGLKPGKAYEITSINLCMPGATCFDENNIKCPGQMKIIDEDGEPRRLCGYGAPWEGFVVINYDWDK